MNKILRLLAYGMGGSGLLAASFLIFASLGGVPLHTLPVVGSLFPTPESELASLPPEPATVEAQVDQDSRRPQQVIDTTTSPLFTFSIQDPWSATELQALEDALDAQKARLTELEAELTDRERELTNRARRYDRLFTELEVMRESLIDQSDEAVAQREENERKLEAEKAERLESLKRVAALYADGDPKQVAGLLLGHQAQEAGEILSLLGEGRAAELLLAIQKVADPREIRAITEAYAIAR